MTPCSPTAGRRKPEWKFFRPEFFRPFLLLVVAGLHISTPAADSPPPTGVLQRPSAVTALAGTERVRGLLLGTLIGDAFGGPMEFQPRDQWSKLPKAPKKWEPGELLDAPARQALRDRLILRSYETLRPLPEPYGQWPTNAPAGTLTDDSRHKLILLHALRGAQRDRAWPLTGERLARAYLDWSNTTAVVQRPDGPRLCREWLDEYWLAARWVAGERDSALALPPERLWNSVPTCAGQMAFPPLAAIFPGDPAAAYRATWDIGWMDNGFARDMNSALVAGLAAALAQPMEGRATEQKWAEVFSAMRRIDPWRFQKVPWSSRAVDRWLDFAHQAAAQAEHQPARLFAAFDREFTQSIKWEAQVCFAVAFGCLAMCPEDPLAALALTIEWGHDTDSYAQLAGAFVGALHGPEIFPATLRDPVERQLRAEYGESVREWANLLVQLRLPPAESPAK